MCPQHICFVAVFSVYSLYTCCVCACVRACVCVCVCVYMCVAVYEQFLIWRAQQVPSGWCLHFVVISTRLKLLSVCKCTETARNDLSKCVDPFIHPCPCNSYTIQQHIFCLIPTYVKQQKSVLYNMYVPTSTSVVN